MSKAKTQLALDLFRVGAVRFGEFKLKLHEKFPDAPLSPIYIDLRIVRSFPEVMESATDVYEELTSQLKFDAYADIPTSVTPLVAVLSYKTRIPMITPRGIEKTHGIKRSIDGVFKVGQTILVVDDLVTLAESKLETISNIEENGLKVLDVAVLIDREQGGVEQLKRKGYTCHSAFKIRDLLKFYLSSSKISVEQYDKVISYLDQDPTKR